MSLKHVSIAFFLLTITGLYFLGQTGSYIEHLQTDVPYYAERASSFLQYGNLAHLVNNEYQPGALLFFMLLSPFFKLGGYYPFSYALFGANIALLFGHAYMYFRQHGYKSLLIFSLLLLALGPVIYFRFDLLVTFLVVLAFFFWQKNKHHLAISLFAAGTLVKVYPVIFIPYLLLLVMKQKGIKPALRLIYTYIGALLFPLLAFIVLYKPDILELYASLQYHAAKPLGLESVWASIVSLTTLITTGNYPPLTTSNGIWGIAGDVIFGLPLAFYNYAWLIPFIILHVYLFITLKKHSHFDMRIPALNLLLFLTFSKVLAPQYVLWFITLVPLLPLSKNKRLAIVSFVLLLIALVLYQILYPLNYTAWLNGLTSGTRVLWLYIVNTTKNMLFILLCGLLTVDVFFKKDTGKVEMKK